MLCVAHEISVYMVIYRFASSIYIYIDLSGSDSKCNHNWVPIVSLFAMADLALLSPSFVKNILTLSLFFSLLFTFRLFCIGRSTILQANIDVCVCWNGLTIEDMCAWCLRNWDLACMISYAGITTGKEADSGEKG